MINLCFWHERYLDDKRDWLGSLELGTSIGIASIGIASIGIVECALAVEDLCNVVAGLIEAHMCAHVSFSTYDEVPPGMVGTYCCEGAMMARYWKSRYQTDLMHLVEDGQFEIAIALGGLLGAINRNFNDGHHHTCEPGANPIEVTEDNAHDIIYGPAAAVLAPIVFNNAPAVLPPLVFTAIAVDEGFDEEFTN